MKSYSQRNPRWSKQKLGNCNVTIGTDGCLTTCFCMVYDDTIVDPKGRTVECHPGILDWLLTEKKMYNLRCKIVQKRVSDFLGLKDDGKTTTPPDMVCIAETDHYGGQHFFIWYPDNTILDPLDGSLKNLWTPKRKANPYKIVSYRLISKIECTHCPVHCK